MKASLFNTEGAPAAIAAGVSGVRARLFWCSSLRPSRGACWRRRREGRRGGRGEEGRVRNCKQQLRAIDWKGEKKGTMKGGEEKEDEKTVERRGGKKRTDEKSQQAVKGGRGARGGGEVQEELPAAACRFSTKWRGRRYDTDGKRGKV
jgi:hypothetical protein